MCDLKRIAALLLVLNFLGSLHLALAETALAPASPPPTVPPSPPPVTSSPCFSGMYNPCGHGTCVNLPNDAYRCTCPKGTTQSTKTNGRPFCVPSALPGLTYTVAEGDTCYIIAITFRLTIASLLDQNPGLNCSALDVGTVLNVKSDRETPSQTCWIRYTVTPVDSCSSIRARFRLPPFRLSTINPALDCNNLLAQNEFLSVCIQENRERSKFYICSDYRVPRASSSRKCNLAVNPRRTQLWNPGLYCGRLFRSPKRYCRKATPYNYLTCSVTYLITSDDSCNTLYYKFGSSNTPLSTRVYLFRNRNRNMACDDKFLFVGQKICLEK